MMPVRHFDGKTISISHVDQLRRLAQSMTPIASDDQMVDHGPNGSFRYQPMQRRRSAGLDLSRFAFGIESITQNPPGGATVRIRAGIVQTPTSIFAVNTQNVALTSNPSIIMMRIQRLQGNSAPNLIVSANVPAPTRDVIHVPLYEFGRAGAEGPFTLVSIHRLGSINI